MTGSLFHGLLKSLYNWDFKRHPLYQTTNQGWNEHILMVEQTFIISLQAAGDLNLTDPVLNLADPGFITRP